VFHSFPAHFYTWGSNLPGIEPMPCDALLLYSATKQNMTYIVQT